MTQKRVFITMLRAACCTLAIGQTWAADVAKNVIFFLGDGMGPAVVTAARHYRYGETGYLHMERLDRAARIKTYSFDAQTTDSSASMAAYMTGVKMNNAVVSMSSDTQAFDANGEKYSVDADSRCPENNGTAVVTLLELSKAAGKSVGAVTTTRITHATPAATFSHVCHRAGENEIAAQVTPGSARYNLALHDGVDVLLGGGLRHFIPKGAKGSKRTDQTNLIALFRKAGYTSVFTRAAFEALDPRHTKKLIGLFNKNHLNYELDRVKQGINEPSLADMTEKAIRILGNNPKGFFLMVEGGRIDHALHQTNAKRALEDTIAFDEAIARALSVADRSNTLIVVTADHDHTMTFNGHSHRGNPILGKVTDLKTKQLKLAADGKPFTTLVFGNGGGPRAVARDDLTAVDTTGDDILQEVGIPLGPPGSETHGGGDVMFFSTGPGSAAFKGTLDNIEIFSRIKTALGI
jgi:alkaline phosphatase